jgi:hypothetical protein
MSEKTLPISRHWMCQESRCEICLADAESLGDYLRSQCGGANNDWLSRYRSFMDKRLQRSSETQYGWFDPVIFLPEHLTAFVNDWNGEVSDE